MNSNCLKKKVNRILINPDADTICVGKEKKKESKRNEFEKSPFFGPFDGIWSETR